MCIRDSLKACPIDVQDWYDDLPTERTHHATVHRGLCKSCHTNLDKVKNDGLLKDVAVFTAKNNWDPLFGLDKNQPDWDPLFGTDTGAAYKEWLHLSRIATVTETMLVALSHMQVSVCYLRHNKHYGTGMPGFRTNIISFPQELLELKKLEHYWSSLEVHDLSLIHI